MKTKKDAKTPAPRNPALPPATDRVAYQAQVDVLRCWEKAHTREGDAISAARRRLPMVEVDSATVIVGKDGPVTLLDAFEDRKQLIAYYLMWYTGEPAKHQCMGCTWVTSQVRELSYMHSRDATFAVFAQGPYPESARYREFMGLDMPWYSVRGRALDSLLAGREAGIMYLICYVRRGNRVFETYWTTRRGVEVMDNNYHLLDLTVYGRQEQGEDSPKGWPQNSIEKTLRVNGRPAPQWARLQAGFSDELGNKAPRKRKKP